MNRILIVAWLVVVWVALWGNISAANILSGTVVAVLVLTVFPVQRANRWGLWVRPLGMWEEQVTVNGVAQPRFARLPDDQQDGDRMAL